MALLSLGVNTVTNVIFNFGAIFVSASQRIWYIIILETVIVFVESLFYYLMIKDYKRAILVALLANLASVGAAQLIYYFIY